MKLTRPALLVAAAAAVLVALPATAASAQTVLHRDATHDVNTLDFSSMAGTFTREPKVPQGDVQAIAIKHARHNVTVTVKFRELAKGTSSTVHQVVFRTNTGERRLVTIAAGPGSWSGAQQMGTPQGGSARCSGMSHTIDYTRNKVTLTVPRSCLGRPRWVEVAESTVRVEDTSSSSTDPTASLNLYIDDAFSPYFTSNTHWSPKVHRG